MKNATRLIASLLLAAAAQAFTIAAADHGHDDSANHNANEADHEEADTAGNHGFKTVTPDDLQWAEIPNGNGAKFTIVSGNPESEGPYVLRVHFPAHTMSRPHSHTSAHHIVVLEGVWTAGTGEDFTPDSAASLPAGSYMFQPAGAVHWDGSNSGQATTVQIIGNGPYFTTQAHDEETDFANVE